MIRLTAMAPKLSSSFFSLSRSSRSASQSTGLLRRLIGRNSQVDEDEPTVYESDALDASKDEIRLIRIIDSGKDDDPICVQLESVELSNAPHYLALSYTWGTATSARKLLIRSTDSAPFSSLTIKSNLYSFLWWYRRVNRGQLAQVYLWIDQISINQSDIQERNHQVHLMSRIYSKSDHVIVWLGEKEAAGPREQSVYHAARAFHNTGCPKAYITLLAHDYFKRLWIIQEVILAKRIDVLAGDTWLSWENLRTFPDTDSYGYKLSYTHSFQQSRDILHLADGTWTNRTLEECILTFSKGVCGDPRDKVYGLMGLVNPECRINVDYAKKACDVYADVVLSCIDRYLRTMLNKSETVRETTSNRISNALYQLGGSLMMGHLMERRAFYFSSRLFDEHRIDRFIGLSSPLTAIGTEPSPVYPGETRWWYDFLGERYYLECEIWHSVDATNNPPLFVDWTEYLPLARQLA